MIKRGQVIRFYFKDGHWLYVTKSVLRELGLWKANFSPATTRDGVLTIYIGNPSEIFLVLDRMAVVAPDVDVPIFHRDEDHELDRLDCWGDKTNTPKKRAETFSVSQRVEKAPNSLIDLIPTGFTVTFLGLIAAATLSVLIKYGAPQGKPIDREPGEVWRDRR